MQHFEVNEFPAIVPALIEALDREPKTGVRLEVVHTLGKLRPVSLPAGQALEKAASHDGSIRVRLQARTTLMWYHLAGYNGAKTPDAPVTTKGVEPPLPGPTQPPGNGKTNGVNTTVTDYRPLPIGPVAGPEPRVPGPVPPPPQPVIPTEPALLPQQNVPPPALLPQQ